MDVIIEKPLLWFKDQRENGRHEFMYNNLKKVLDESGLRIIESNYEERDDYSERIAPTNGFYLSYHSIGFKKNVWRIKETPIPYFYSIDKRGHSGWSELSSNSPEYAKHVEDARKFPESIGRDIRVKIKNWLIDNHLSKYTQSDEIHTLPDNFIFYPLQTNHDPVRVHDNFSQIKAIFMLSLYAFINKNHVVTKIHPYYTGIKIKFLIKVMEKFNKFFHTSNMSLTKLLPACSAVFVANSGAGFEALIYGKPVYSFSASEYDMAVIKIKKTNEIRKIFNKTHIFKTNVNPDSYIGYFFTKMAFDSRNETDIRNKINKIVDVVQSD